MCSANLIKFAYFIGKLAPIFPYHKIEKKTINCSTLLTPTISMGKYREKGLYMEVLKNP
jgi:hypothetical protein